MEQFVVVSYRNSTSNHNSSSNHLGLTELYLIEILHQTTTYPCHAFFVVSLYLIEILHQTTTIDSTLDMSKCCILSKFYIKPQQLLPCAFCGYVVSYRNSTSNHNSIGDDRTQIIVVSYRNSTSNHNVGPHID